MNATYCDPVAKHCTDKGMFRTLYINYIYLLIIGESIKIKEFPCILIQVKPKLNHNKSSQLN